MAHQDFAVNRDVRTCAEKIAVDATNMTNVENAKRIRCGRRGGRSKIMPKQGAFRSLVASRISEDSRFKAIISTAKETDLHALRSIASTIYEDTLREISSLLRGLRTR